MPRILSFYIARRLLSTIGIAFAIIFTLVFLIDFVDLLQDAAQRPEVTLGMIVLIGLQRSPLATEAVLPFVVLFGSIAAFATLSRKMELIVARASGVSIWQILAPALLAAAMLGIAATALYNPVSTYLKEYSVSYQAKAFGLAGGRSVRGGQWIRQRSTDGQSIVRAAASKNRGRTLAGVTAFVFTTEGAFVERVDAPSAVLRAGYWEFRSARVVRQGAPPESHTAYQLETNLTPDQVAETIATPETISFWALPEVIAQWDQTGLHTEKFKLQYQRLVARPALYVAMVLIAAAVSLGFTRLGGISRAILGGVLAGFVLYVGGEMAGDLGAAGFITPAVAAWAPSIVGVLLSVTVLLHQEDG